MSYVSEEMYARGEKEREKETASKREREREKKSTPCFIEALNQLVLTTRTHAM